MVVKQRSLNELRQEKEFGYKHPSVQKKKINVDPQHIINLVKENPNDMHLGKGEESIEDTAKVLWSIISIYIY